MFRGRKTRSRSRAEAAASSQPAQPLPPPTADQLDPTGTDPEFFRDPEAAKHERNAGFEMPWGFQYRNYLKLKKRPLEHTRFIDIPTLEKYGVAEQFLELTSKVGITPNFWNFREYAYPRYTLEFLSSLKLYDYNGRDYIVYRLGNIGRRAWLDELSEVFLLENGTVDTFDYSRDPNNKVTREIVWEYLCGRGHKLQSRHVQHPTLRIALRGISATVFARGETVNLAQDRDIGFMWHMLQPEPAKINVMKLMVNNWIYQRDLKHAKGSITMGSFVTILAKRHGLPLPSSTTCTGYTHYDDERFAAASFLKICHMAPEVEGKYLWLRDQGSNFYLPYPHKVEVSNPRTWLVPHDYVTPRASVAMQQPTPMETDTAGPSERHTSPPRTGFSYESDSSIPQWARDLMSVMGNLTKLTMENRDEIRKSTEEIQRLSGEFVEFGKRLDHVTEVNDANNYFLRTGQWPSDDDFSSPLPSVHSHASSSHSPPPQPQEHEQPQPTGSYEAEDHFDIFPSYGSQQGGPYGGGPYGGGGPYDGYNPYGGGGPYGGSGYYY